MKNFVALTISVILILFLLLGYSVNVNSQISDNIVRLHVIANSDCEQDQALKLKVRDAILEHENSNFTSKADVGDRIELYKKIAENVIRKNGYDYSVTAEYGNFRFPTKHYNNISLPAGYYDALRIKIGDAEGANWWCVMFPPLCFVDGTTTPAYAEEKLKSVLDEDSYDIITANKDGNLPFEIKFKIVELCSSFGKNDKIYKSAGKD